MYHPSTVPYESSVGDFPTVLLPGPRGMRGFPWTLQVRRVANRTVAPSVSLDSPRDPSGHRLSAILFAVH